MCLAGAPVRGNSCGEIWHPPEGLSLVAGSGEGDGGMQVMLLYAYDGGLGNREKALGSGP